MANFYFLVTLGSGQTAAARRATVLARTSARQGVRVQPHQLGHLRESHDGSFLLVQAEVTSEEYAFLESRTYVTVLGQYRNGRADPTVFAYLAAHPTLWDTPGKPSG